MVCYSVPAVGTAQDSEYYLNHCQTGHGRTVALVRYGARELYALWQGVVGHERLIKGFKCYCYIDHKNNLFSEAQLDNRRRSKKMSNWALELQGFDIIRIWIRGEANILADAPSRAPWGAELAKHLPTPDRPLRDLVQAMYKSPEQLTVWVEE